MILGDLEFKAEDFPYLKAILHRAEIEGLLVDMNRLLRERLENAPETECDGDPRLDPDSYEGCAPRFTARLVCVEKISK